ncbi:hypothetical protein Palpr_0059 [Paludibacter propionicigenes WB4]|uniref:Uncharacterized protein n=1 Tax=Paludibacter propionicigenes (strain DSM 17365 / JCM 13257 / WB4) TaxID=694427 RepID=E4T0U6_PALPW|nr:hypothetical protein Palpr_0059 [Paludibacter propionicigenes WB4]
MNTNDLLAKLYKSNNWQNQNNKFSQYVIFTTINPNNTTRYYILIIYIPL